MLADMQARGSKEHRPEPMGRSLSLFLWVAKLCSVLVLV